MPKARARQCIIAFPVKREGEIPFAVSSVLTKEDERKAVHTLEIITAVSRNAAITKHLKGLRESHPAVDDYAVHDIRITELTDPINVTYAES